jgi:serine/threonine protein kinase
MRPHPNVVQLYGISTDGPNPVMIIEFCEGGSLDTKLYKARVNLSLKSQLQLISGIAKGLLHLHTNKIVHRDLAARNILLVHGKPKISVSDTCQDLFSNQYTVC